MTTNPNPTGDLADSTARDAAVLQRQLDIQHMRAEKALTQSLSAMYRSAGESRLRKDLRGARGSDDYIHYQEREKVVNVSRTLLAQSPVYDGFLERMIDFTIGTGMVPVGEGQNSPADEACRLFLEWLERDADIRGLDGGGELQRKILREALAFGDCLTIKVVDEDQRIQITPSHLVASPSKQPPRTKRDNSGPRISEGIEMNDAGRPVKFWITTYDTTGGSLNVGKETSRTVKAENALFFALRKFAGQTRGMPWLASVLERFIDVNEFIDAVVTAAKLQAALAVLVTSKTPGAVGSKLISGAQSVAGQGDSGGSNRTENLMDMNPGKVIVLPNGDDAKGIQGSQPNATFETFIRGILVMACAGAGMPYEIAIGDFSRANFSVSRMARIAAQQTAGPLRKQLVRSVLQPLYEWRIDRLIATGVLKPSLRDQYLEIRWQAPAMVPIDPKAETDAAVLQIDNNLRTKKAVIDELGGDIDLVFAQRAEEKKQEMDLDIEPVRAPGTKTGGEDAANGDAGASTRGKPEPEDDGEDDGEE